MRQPYSCAKHPFSWYTPYNKRKGTCVCPSSSHKTQGASEAINARAIKAVSHLDLDMCVLGSLRPFGHLLCALSEHLFRGISWCIVTHNTLLRCIRFALAGCLWGYAAHWEIPVMMGPAGRIHKIVYSRTRAPGQVLKKQRWWQRMLRRGGGLVLSAINVMPQKRRFARTCVLLFNVSGGRVFINV